MPFQVISPMLMNVDGSDFHQAVKNFVKLNRHLHINELILTDHVNNMRANIHYYNRNGRHKAGISLHPTPYNVINTFAGQPSAIIEPNGAVRNIQPVVPVTLDGKPLNQIAPMFGVTPSNIMAIGANGPIIRNGMVGPSHMMGMNINNSVIRPVSPMFGSVVPTPITFAPASTTNAVEWVDSNGTKVQYSDEIEKEYANLNDKKKPVYIQVRNMPEYAVIVELSFSENKCQIIYYASGPVLKTIDTTRKGPTSNYKMMVGVTPQFVGPMPQF